MAGQTRSRRGSALAFVCAAVLAFALSAVGAPGAARVALANTPPDAVDDAATVAQDGGATALDVLANDTDADLGNTLTVTTKTDGANGAVEITGAGVSYTPNAGYSGPDSFTYTISDGQGGTDTATVTVTVKAFNRGQLSFSAQSSSVNESDGGATLWLNREGGSDGEVVAKVTLTDVTTSPTDHAFAPGSLDTSFNPGTGVPNGYNGSFSSRIDAVAAQPDGKIIIAGVFDQYNGEPRSGVARLNADGSLDNTFYTGTGSAMPGYLGGIHRLALQPDGKIIIGGFFSAFNGVPCIGFARLNANGSFDICFNTDMDPSMGIRKPLVTPDGKVVLFGHFTSYNGTPRKGVVRLNPDGSLDTSFNPGAGMTGGVRDAAAQPDGKIIIVGEFTSYAGTPRTRIARLNTDGSLDTSFDPGSGPNNSVEVIAIQPDGKVIIGGFFTFFNGVGRNRIARLNANGSLDTTFNPGWGVPAGFVRSLALQEDGKIILAGGLESYNSVPTRGIARATANGAADPTFTHGMALDSGVNAVALQPDGKIVVGGYFANYNGISRNRIARLNTDFQVRWADGDSAPKPVPFPIINDYLKEPDESVTLTVTPLTAGVGTGAFPSHTVTILDEDLPQPVADSQSVTVGENSPKTITLTGSSVDGAPLTYRVVTYPNPLRGHLSGSGAEWVYTPRPGIKGTDSFTFTVNDGRIDSEPATVSITISEGGSLKFGATAYSVSEGKTFANVTVLRALGSAGPASVQYSTSDGTATGGLLCSSGTDYKSATGTLSWAEGDMTNRTITVPLCSDIVFEGNETVNLKLSNATGSATLGSPAATVLTIQDDETQPTLHVNNITTVEGNTNTTATFVVSLSRQSSKTVTVMYQMYAGTATANADYTPHPLTKLTFAPGEIAQTIAVQIKGDLLDELSPETFRVTLSSPTNATIEAGVGTATCSIHDNDAPPSLRISDDAVVEGTGTAVPASFKVTLSAPSGQTVTVKYATANGTATATTDYTPKALTILTFAPGETSKTVVVPVAGDALDEATEKFSVVLSAATNASIADGLGVASIADNDLPPKVTVSDVTVTEANAGTVNAVFTVKLSAVSGLPVTVKYQTANGTAAATADYAAIGLTALSFSPGETSKTVTVLVKGETLKEANETFFLNLSGAINTTIGDAQGAGTILNDD